MKIAIPKEIKNNEFRVAITPAGVHDLVANGHDVIVETGAGLGSTITDEDFASAGARIAANAKETWSAADLLLKVKEPVHEEYQYFRDDLLLFAYLHLAAEPELTSALVSSKVTAIAYETVQLPNRSLPLLAPMSEVAGRLAPIVGANAMLKPNGGPGLLVPGVPGTHPANLHRLRELDALYAGRVKTIASNGFEIDRALVNADLVIGSVLIPGAKAPKLVSNELVSRMKPGSVLVDIAVDQGGCFADSHPTTHDNPTFAVHGSLFYCVANMPGAVPNTSTYALTNATLPYARALASHGWRAALAADDALARGLNIHGGSVINEQVATALGFEHVSLESMLA
jgi:alanine dehydrogenase